MWNAVNSTRNHRVQDICVGDWNDGEEVSGSLASLNLEEVMMVEASSVVLQVFQKFQFQYSPVRVCDQMESYGGLEALYSAPSSSR